ncbi:MAG: RNA methyltransferase [Pirellulales bacterium]|nr:RNA methyltransferase [Pirellulales bacterium]
MSAQDDDGPLQARHKPPSNLERPRELVIACAPLRSNVNLSRILRTAGCCGVERVIACGAVKVVDKIARDAATTVHVEVHRTLLPQLARLRADGFRLAALEQAENSVSLHHYAFERRTALILGNEREGLDADVLRQVHDIVEIPVYGLPYAYNVATAAAMAMYEYCRQFPRG